MSVLRLLRLFFLFISLWGYLQYFSRKLKPELALGFILASIGSIMFFAGIAGSAPFNLPYAAWIIFAAGLILAALSLKDIKSAVLRTVSAGTVFFVIMCAFFFITLRGNLFVHYDNFSHWALAPEVLINFDRFPVAEDLQITFQSYPLGSAAFIYFVAEIYGGNSEWLMMFSQAMLMCGFISSVFAFAKCTKGKIIAAVTAFMLLCSNTSFVDLLVDSLLPAVAVSGIALLIFYRNSIADKMLYVIPHIVFLTSVKNSGILFAAFIAVYAFAVMPKNKNCFKKLVVCAAGCPATLFIWQEHVKATFAGGMTSRHAMSLDYFMQVIGIKDMGIIAQTAINMCKETFSLGNTVLYLFAFVLIVIMLEKADIAKNLSLLKHLSAVSVLSYIAYQIGTFGMYIFAMPDRDATTTLTSYERYHRSIVIFVAALVLIGILDSDISLDKFIRSKKLASVLMTATCIAVFFIGCKPDFSMYIPQSLKTPTQRHLLENLAAEYGVNKGSSYMLLLEENDKSGYNFFMARYALGSLNVEERTAAKLLENDSVLKNYEYLIVIDNSENTRSYLNTRYGDSTQKVVHLPEYYHLLGT